MTDRKSHWENVYTRNTPQDVSWFQAQASQSLRLVQNTGIDRSAAIIDVGGGASTLVDSLLDDGHTNLSVLDLSGRALEHARQRLGDRAKQVNWHEADVTTFKPSQSYALWHDRAVFHFLTDANDRAAYRQVLSHALQPGGHLVIMAFALDGPRKCSGLEIVQYDENKLSAELGVGFTLLETGRETHLTPSGNAQNFAYFYFQKSQR